MSGKTIGYIRVSSYDQNPDRQLDGIHLDKIFVDKASGKDIKRPAFDDLLNYVREGDLLVVHSLDLEHLRYVVKVLTTKGIQVKFLKENLIFTGDDSPMSNLLLSVMGAFAEFERSFIKERQMEGIALAKQRGAFKGRKKTLSIEQVEVLKKRGSEGEKKTQIARDLNISRETLYQYLRG